MEDSKKTKEQLISELNEARHQIETFDARLEETKKAEAYIKLWRETFYKAFDANPNPLCLVNVVNSKFTHVNNAFVQFSGYSREEIIGHTHQELNLFVNPDELKNMDKNLQETGFLVNAEIESRMKSGEIRTALFSAETFELSGTNYLLLLITDITSVKKMEASLRESESKFAVAFRASPHALVIVTMGEGRFIEVNDNVCLLTGYSREEIIGHTLEELKIWDDQDFRIRMAKALWEKGRITNEELVWHTRTGQKLDMIMSGEITDIGEKKCIVASITDITYLKQMEQDLRTSEERFSKAFHSSPGILSITRASDGTFLEINDAFPRVFGFTRAETIGHKSLEMNLWVNPDDRKSMIHKLMENGHVRNEQYQHRTKSGDIRTLLFSAESIEFDGEPCVLAMTNDITEYKRIEAEAHEATNLRELDRLRTEILANVSHELRTPLAGIKGFATMLLDYDKRLSAKEKREYLETIDKNTDRMVELIEQLLEMSRLGTGMLSINKAPTNIIELCQNVLIEARVRAPVHNFTLNLPPKLPMINIDNKRIRQVLDNILNNAVKYSSPGTEIKLSARQVDKDMLFSVTDHGVGIPEKDLPNLFQRMFHPSHLQKMGTGGTGLGLSISKGLVEAHGGKIWIESEEGVGTNCYFSLPIDGKQASNPSQTKK
jgi:PAS domain S-box-containing protein